MHCSRDGHDRVEMYLLQEDSGAGTRVYRCPACGWEAKQYGAPRATATPRARGRPKPGEHAIDMSGDRKLRFRITLALTVAGMIAAMGAVTLLSRDIPTPTHRGQSRQSDVTRDVVKSDQPGVSGQGGEASYASQVERSCDDGVAIDCDHLGGLYEFGDSVKQNQARAAALYERACGGGVVRACGKLAGMFVNGVGVRQDFMRAVHFYRLACDGGIPQYCGELGYMHYSGEGVTRDYYRASALFERACNDGDPYGCSGLAAMYQNGVGVARDTARAADLYAMACSNGYLSARHCSRR